MRATRSRADAAGRAACWARAGGAGWAERLIGPSALGRAGVTGWAAGKKEPLGFAGGSKLGRGIWFEFGLWVLGFLSLSNSFLFHF